MRTFVAALGLLTAGCFPSFEDRLCYLSKPDCPEGFLCRAGRCVSAAGDAGAADSGASDRDSSPLVLRAGDRYVLNRSHTSGRFAPDAVVHILMEASTIGATGLILDSNDGFSAKDEVLIADVFSTNAMASLIGGYET